MSNSDILAPLEPDKYYHIFNHANGKENLFIKEDNYQHLQGFENLEGVKIRFKFNS